MPDLKPCVPPALTYAPATGPALNATGMSGAIMLRLSAILLAGALSTGPGAAGIAQAQVAAPAGTATAPAANEKLAKPAAENPALEARVMAISEELRCLVCQNETIAASHADLAVDLRKQIRIKLTQGQSQQQILDFMVERYGDFVLYRPPLKATTVLLWAGPFALLAGAVLVLVLNIRRRRLAEQPRALSPEELLRARQLLGSDALTMNSMNTKGNHKP